MNHPDSNFNQSELEHRVTLDAQRIQIVMNSEQLRKNMDHTSSRPLGKKKQTQHKKALVTGEGAGDVLDRCRGWRCGPKRHRGRGSELDLHRCNHHHLFTMESGALPLSCHRVTENRRSESPPWNNTTPFRFTVVEPHTLDYEPPPWGRTPPT
jgi:hypothetical protein